MGNRIAIGIAAFLALALGTTFWMDAYKSHREIESVTEGLPRLERERDYVSSKTCRACHPDEYDSWHRTYHRTMTQVARPDTVLGDFDGSVIHSHGLDYKVTREGNTFYADMPHPDEVMYIVQGGKPTPLDQVERIKARVVMTTGSHHYQTYWVESPTHDGVLQTLPLVYLKEDKQWIPREAAFMNPPESKGGYITQWNHHCIRCHSTGGSPGLDETTGELRTEVGELGIACESCHGPAEQHVAFHQNPINRYAGHIAGDSQDDIVNPSKLNHQRSSEICGQCHGVFVNRDEYAMQYAREGIQYKPGDELEKFRYYIQHPATTGAAEDARDFERNPEFYEQRWWPDGTILAGGREYSAMAVSKCYTHGDMSCASCHSMHSHAEDPKDQLIPEMTERQMCVQCHDAPEFTTELEIHTKHPVDSSGSECLNCHMPYKAYALLGAIRSHQIDSPNLESSATHGGPNACNLCHLDQTLAWTQQHLVHEFGYSPVELNSEQESISAALLRILKGDAAQRAVTAWSFGWRPAQEISRTDWVAPFLAFLLRDPYGVVRYVAKESLKSTPGFEDLEFDFLADRDELIAAWRQVINQWTESVQTQPISLPDPRILIDNSSRLLEQDIVRLLRERDNRPVSIRE